MKIRLYQFDSYQLLSAPGFYRLQEWDHPPNSDKIHSGEAQSALGQPKVFQSFPLYLIA